MIHQTKKPGAFTPGFELLISRRILTSRPEKPPDIPEHQRHGGEQFKRRRHIAVRRVVVQHIDVSYKIAAPANALVAIYFPTATQDSTWTILVDLFFRDRVEHVAALLTAVRVRVSPSN